MTHRRRKQVNNHNTCQNQSDTDDREDIEFLPVDQPDNAATNTIPAPHQIAYATPKDMVCTVRDNRQKAQPQLANTATVAGKEVNCCVLGNREVATTSSTMASDSITGGGRDKSMFESTTRKQAESLRPICF